MIVEGTVRLIEDEINFCKVCGNLLDANTWNPLHTFDGHNGFPEYSRFKKCSNPTQQIGIPVEHTFVQEFGYKDIAGLFHVTSHIEHIELGRRNLIAERK